MDTLAVNEGRVPQRTKSFIRTERLPDKIKQWRNALLREVPLIQKVKGQRAGRLIVYGDDAVPLIFSGKPEHVILAAAEVGQGRVLALSQHMVLENFDKKSEEKTPYATLHDNIKQWITQGKVSDDIKVVNLAEVKAFEDEVSADDIIFWNDVQGAAPAFDEQVLEFIRGGGGLVYGMTVYKWKKAHPKLNLDCLPLGGVWKEIGIAFSPITVQYDTENGIAIDRMTKGINTSLSLAHARVLIKKCTQENAADQLRNLAKLFVQYFQNVPSYVIGEVEDKLSVLFEKCSPSIEQHVPDPEDKVTGTLALSCLSICGMLSELQLGFTKIPGIQKFPGDFEEDTVLDLKCTELEIDAKTAEVHATGYWVPAGQKVEVKVIQMGQGEDAEAGKDEGAKSEANKGEAATDLPEDKADGDVDGWFIRIGSQSDSLHHKDMLKRWPNLMVKVPLKSHMQVFTPYGGLLYFVSPEKSSKLRVQISGVVAAPLFDLRDSDSADKWKESRKAPGLWADICGVWFRITVPSSTIREMSDPTELMQLWDQVIETNHDLRGTPIPRREWLVADVQPVIGRMHSGYPLVALMSIAEPDGALNLARMKTHGYWGVFHELGHNMQRNMWTFEGTREVTCNIFAFHAMHMVVDQPVWIHEWLKQHMPKIESYLRDGADFQEWQTSNGVAVAFYAQLAHHFEWGSYKRVFRSYEALPAKKRPATTQARIDEWVLRFSLATSHNVLPMAEFWGLPVTTPMPELKSLKPFLPNDEMIDMAPERAKFMIQKYPNLTREVDKDKLGLDKHWCPIL